MMDPGERRGLLEDCTDDDEAIEWSDEASGSTHKRHFSSGSVHKQQAGHGLDRSFILLGCLTFAVSDINYHMLPPFLLRHLLKRGVSEAGVGIVMATPAAIMLVAVFTLPALARYSRLHLVIAGLVANSVGSLLLTLIDVLPDGQPVLVLAFVLMLAKGFATGTFEVVMRGLLLAAAPPEQVAMVVGWLAASRNLGGLLGPVAGGLLFELGGLKLPALFGAILTVPLVLALRCKEDAAPPHDSSNSGGDGGGGHPEGSALPSKDSTERRLLLRQRSVPMALCLIFFSVVNVDMLGVSLPLYLSEPHKSGGPFALSSSAIGALTSARYVVATLAALAHGSINDRLGDELEASVGTVLMVVSLLAMGPWPPIVFLPQRLETTAIATCLFAVAFELMLLPNTSMMISAAHRASIDVKVASGVIASLDQATGTTAAVTGRLLGGALIRPLGYRNEFAAFALLPTILLPLLFVRHRRAARGEKSLRQMQEEAQQPKCA